MTDQQAGKAVEQLAKRRYEHKQAGVFGHRVPWREAADEIKERWLTSAREDLAAIQPFLVQPEGSFEYRVNDHAGIHGPLDRESAEALRNELAEADPPPPRFPVVESRWVEEWRPEVEADAHHCGNCGVRSHSTLTDQCHKCGAPEYGHPQPEDRGGEVEADAFLGRLTGAAMEEPVVVAALDKFASDGRGYSVATANRMGEALNVAIAEAWKLVPPPAPPQLQLSDEDRERYLEIIDALEAGERPTDGVQDFAFLRKLASTPTQQGNPSSDLIEALCRAADPEWETDVSDHTEAGERLWDRIAAALTCALSAKQQGRR